MNSRCYNPGCYGNYGGYCTCYGIARPGYINTVEADISGLSASFEHYRDKVKALKSEYRLLNNEVSSLKEDVSSLKTKLNETNEIIKDFMNLVRISKAEETTSE